METEQELNDKFLAQTVMKVYEIIPECPFVLGFKNDSEKKHQINNTQQVIDLEPVEKIFYSVGGQSYKEIVAEFENWINQS